MAEKTRYTDEELEEFRQIINEKLRLARLDYEDMMKQLTNANSNDIHLLYIIFPPVSLRLP